MEEIPREKSNKKPKEKTEKKPQEKLGEFSELLIKLGKEIEKNLGEKSQLEEQIRLKEAEIWKIEKDIFIARTRLSKLNLELARLEAKRKEFEEKKFLFGKE